MLARNICALGFLGVVITSTAAAQQQPEYFTIANTSREPMWVTLRGHDWNGRQKDWIPYKRIEPGEMARWQLISFDPFDIYIYHKNHESLRFDGVNLHWIMNQCAATRRWRWKLQALREKERRVALMVPPDNKTVYKTSRVTCCAEPGISCYESFAVHGDGANVTLDSASLFPPQDPPIDDPYDPKNPNKPDGNPK